MPTYVPIIANAATNGAFFVKRLGHYCKLACEGSHEDAEKRVHVEMDARMKPVLPERGEDAEAGSTF